MNLLGIDYGEKYIGLAISTGGFPQTLKVIKSKSKQHKINEIIKICSIEKIDKIIIGEGSEFINKLREKLPIPIVIINETLTSREARLLMISDNIAQSKKKEMEHAYSAVIILRLYQEKDTYE